MSAYPSIPGFRCDAVLGRGGMATVYGATDEALGRRVAIKVVSAEGRDGAQHVRRLEQEARGLATLQHPHIVELHSFGRTADGALYYVMPLLEGGDLTRMPKPLEPERLVALLDRLLDALSHAHAAGIVHRDLKPENILFDRNGRPLLADFGAAYIQGASRLTEHGRTIGSSYYMSPEQSRGLEVDARSDLYSLGVLAFEYLTGRLPYEGEDDLSIALAKLEQPVPRLPPPFEHWQGFFDRALAADPAQRHESADAMRAALSFDAPRRRPPPTTPRASPGGVPLRGWLAAGAAMLVLALLASLWDASDVSPEAIDAVIDEGRFAAPGDDGSAVALLVRARDEGLAESSAAPLRARVMDALVRDASAALDSTSVDARIAAVSAWDEAAAALDARLHPGSQALRGQLQQRIGDELATAIRRHDRDAATPALALLAAWSDAPPTLVALADQARQLRAVGERFADPQGPPLVYAAAAGDESPPLAVMASPVDPELYARFLADRGEIPADCPEAPRGLQGCLGIEDAELIADWLATKTGARYRVPSREELASVIERVEVREGRAWSNTCHGRRVAQPQNVVRRTWSGVRQVFGRDRLSTRTTLRCDGRYTVPLDRAERGAEPRERASADTVVLLVREMSKD